MLCFLPHEIMLLLREIHVLPASQCLSARSLNKMAKLCETRRLVCTIIEIVFIHRFQAGYNHNMI